MDISYSQHDMERSYYDSDEDEIDNNNGDIKIKKQLLLLNKIVGLIEDDVSIHTHPFTTPETSLLETSSISINSENSEAQTHTLPGKLIVIHLPPSTRP